MPLAPEEFRREFALDPEVVFLNHGSFGAAPRRVLDYQAEIRRRLELNPVGFLKRELPDLMEEARACLGDYLGAEQAGLGLLPNATTGINAVARSLRLEPGDEIVLTDHEYGAMRLLWDEVAARSGACVVVVVQPVPYEDSLDVVEAFAAALTDRTRVVFFSHVTSLSAIVLPAAELCALAREAGAVSVVDGAHAPGQLDLDLDAIGADCYAGNAHKWLCAPKGSAFLYAGEAAREWVGADIVSWGWSWDGAEAFRGRFSWRGTSDPSALLSIPEAIRFQQEHDWPEVRRRCRALAEQTAGRLVAEVGAVELASRPLQAPQMVSVSLADTDPDELERMLWERHRIELPVDRLNDLVVARLSVQAYTTAADCDALVSAIVRP
ncbi:MAG TPA: aminotransferase class V-fold PLP-dependent enzyme [Gaiellaceae bacterium]